MTFVAIALAIRLMVADALPPGFPFLTFFPAVILTTLLAGLWPGTVAAVLGGLAALWFFIPPINSFAIDNGGALALGFYALVVGVDIVVIHIMNTALDRLDAERGRSAALTQQARVMFSELQHRVSNNLQVISSLLMIQAGKVSDPAAARALEEARTRVATLGRLHRALHNPTEQDVDMGHFLSDLCRDVIDAAGAERVRWDVAAKPVTIAPDRLVPTALIVTELLSNALEHGFPNREGGHIWVALEPLDAAGGYRLAVRDNGTGLPETFRLEDQTSLGLQIARSLAHQIGGRITMENDTDNGTVCTLAVAGSG
ncbi:MAG TPA: histidine kinase dimerization/phosphoacceptor domain -containing protein [Magnetospirillum sp.]|nr:histidine kinase dimerization/phosphoacceptor domain -containing protein [Magnetospirillum sp.]